MGDVSPSIHAEYRAVTIKQVKRAVDKPDIEFINNLVPRHPKNKDGYVKHGFSSCLPVGRNQDPGPEKLHYNLHPETRFSGTNVGMGEHHESHCQRLGALTSQILHSRDSDL